MDIEHFDPSNGVEDLQMIADSAFRKTPDSKIDEWFSFSEMIDAINANKGVCLVMLDDSSKKVGFIYAQQENPINGQEGKEKWVIVITAVDPQLSGSGYGSQLLSGIEKAAKDKGAIKMFVYTNKGDGTVVNFYKKNGYRDAGYISDYQYGKDNSAVFLLKYI